MITKFPICSYKILKLSIGILILTFCFSCNASISVKLFSDGSAGIKVDTAIPESVATKMASFRENEEDLPLFSTELVRLAASERKIKVDSLSTPSNEQLSGNFTVANLSDVIIHNKALSTSGLLEITQRKDGGTLRFHLDRENAKNLPLLFPGLDPYILEALSPPAVEEAPITVSEYRSMLKSLFGSKNMPAIDACKITITIAVSGKIIEGFGGNIENNLFFSEINVVEALVLERPVEFFISWKN